MFSPARQTRAAWIALCAVLFAALSSTLAVLYTHDRAGLMADICSAAGITKALAADEGDGPLPAKSGRGVYCVDCLNGASLQAVVAPAMTQFFAQVAGSQAVPGPTTPAVAIEAALPPPSRGPPIPF